MTHQSLRERFQLVETQADVGMSAARSIGLPRASPPLTFPQLKKIAGYFGHGVLYFLETDRAEEQQVYTLIAKEVLYRSQGDENAFFAWLNSIQCVSQVRGVDRELQIQLGAPTDAELRELIALFFRYGIEQSQLAQLLNPQNAAWFRDEKSAYWHSGVFGQL
jgi:hypothetical protein